MAKVSLLSLDYVVFDFETTGLNPHEGDEIIEIGAVKLRGADITHEKFQALVSIKRPIPKQASLVHGITDEDLKDKPPIEEVFPKFMEFVGNKTLIAHNASFDLEFIKRNLERFPHLSFANHCIDTLQLSRQFFSYEKGHNLDAISNRLGLRRAAKQSPGDLGRHRSLGDCYLTAQIFSEFLKSLKRRNISTLHDIRSCVMQPPKILPVHEQESFKLL